MRISDWSSDVCSSDLREKALEKVDRLVSLAHKYGMHASLNLHRAPGYCINAGFREPYYLWTDQEALEAFCFHWEMWARRYRNIPKEKISFDLVNEPRSEEHTSELQSLMRISYAVFCLKKKNNKKSTQETK